MRVLYLTHYSIMEPLGQSQILPYLIGLAGHGYSLEILSFEKPVLLEERERVRAQNQILRGYGIDWFPRSYHRGASLHDLILDILKVSAEVNTRCRCNRIDLIHCRVHVPFLMAWYASAIQRKPILFDFRGFLAEEYVDAGLWEPNGVKYRLTKLLERKMAAWCSAMVVLTHPAREYIMKSYEIPGEKLFVVPCCVDLQRFRLKDPVPPRAPGRPLNVVYSGSTEGRYDIQAMLSFFSRLRAVRPESRLTVLSTGDTNKIQALVEAASLPGNAVSIRSLPHYQVPEFLSRQDIGLLFLRGNLALIASSPTKMGEYLACGLTVVAEQGLGGLERILVEEGVGCLVGSDQPASWDEAICEAIRLCDQPDSRVRSVKTAAKYYSLEQGVETYAQAYEYAVRSRAHGFGSSRAL
jgi:glycosyltransferase involved in cell wall biosynthesis